MPTYSFLDVNATIVGPGGIISLGADAGTAGEGLSIEFVDDKDTMTIGSDGSAMHSLHASTASTIQVRLQKTSPANQQLSAMYDLQSVSSVLWGINVLTISDVARGDVTTALGAAFRRFPSNTYATEGNTVEWTFNCGKTYVMLGSGQPAL